MAMGLAICFIMLIKLVTAVAETPTTLNKTCVGNISVLLQFDVYQESCPVAEPIILSWVQSAISEEPRMAASLLRLHFHDCFVNGCDASVLLDDTDNFVGEKTAPPNLNSLRGFEVIDAIKSDLESVCPQTVSCADILAIVARDSVLLVYFHSSCCKENLATIFKCSELIPLLLNLQSGGPGWEVQTGRRDSLTASKAAATNSLPAPNSSVATLVANFQNVGLTQNDMVALSGAHTIGKARCSTFNSRFLSPGNSGGPDVNMDFVQSLQQLCSETSDSTTTVAHLDLVTPATFDNQYYVNLISGEGLLPSDQVLVAQDDSTREIVESYAEDPLLFFEDFKNSMIKMGALGPLTGDSGEIRMNCRAVN